MTLKVAQNSNAPGYFPLYIADKQGFFKAQGLTFDPYPIPKLGTGTITTQAVESSSIELAAGVITDAFTLSRVDARIKLLGLLSTDLEAAVVVNKEFEQKSNLLALTSLQDKIQALVGKKLGVTSIGAATDAILIYLFKQIGLDAHKAATVEPLGGSNTVAGLAALANGRVDAICFPDPAGQIAEMQGIGDRFISMSSTRPDVPALKGITTSVLYAKQSVIDAKPKAVAAFIRAIAQAEDYIHKNPDKSRALLEKYLKLNQKGADSIATSLLPGFPANPLIDQQGYDEANQFHLQAGLIAIALPYNDLVDSSAIQNALKSGPSSS